MAYGDMRDISQEGMIKEFKQKMVKKNQEIKQLAKLVKNAFVEGYSYAKREKSLWKAWAKSSSRIALEERI